jgi:hypothetical protein
MNKVLKHGYVLALILTIAACGGSPKSKDPKPTASSTPATSSTPAISSSLAASSTSSDLSKAFASTSSSSTRKTTDLTLTGKVTDSDIAFADLVFTVGSQTFTTKANTSGDYTVLLSVYDEELSKPIKALAKGMASQPEAEFVSLLPSMNSLMQQAGADKTLDKTENFSVNITNVTTAEFALLTQNDADITNDDELKIALLAVDADQKLNLAATIKIIVDNDIYVLPQGISSTLALALNYKAASNYTSYLTAKAPSLVASMIEIIKADKNLVTGSVKPIAGEYLLGGFYALEINADGTGHMTKAESYEDFRSFAAESDFTWARIGNTIKLTFPKDINLGPAADPLCEVENKCASILRGIEFSIITENEMTKLVEWSTKKVVMHLETLAILSNKTSKFIANLINRKNLPTPTSDHLAGEWLTGLGEKITYRANGTGKIINVRTDTEDNFTWTLKTNSVLMDFNNGSPASELWFTKNIRVGYDYVLRDNNVVGKKMFNGIMIKRQNIKITSNELVGRWSAAEPSKNYSETYDIYSDSSWSSGFGSAIKYRWEINNDHQYTTFEFDFRIVRDFIAIDGATYYAFECGWFSHATPTPSFCFISAKLKNNSFSSDQFWARWNRPLFNEEVSGIAWSFGWDSITSAGIDVTPLSENFGNSMKINFNKINYMRSGKSTVLELITANQNTVDVCEYDADKQCDEGRKFTLVRGIDVEVKINGNQGTSYESGLQSRNQPAIYTFTPNSYYGLTLKSVTGCGGTLDGFVYTTESLTADCSITANFE